MSTVHMTMLVARVSVTTWASRVLGFHGTASVEQKRMGTKMIGGG
jgi:hypothetical protein